MARTSRSSAREHLGAASLADQASREQVRAVRRARSSRRAKLEADLRAVEKDPPAAVRGADHWSGHTGRDADLVRAARPRLLPPGPPAPGLVLPRPSGGWS
jgi:putative transposase